MKIENYPSAAAVFHLWFRLRGLDPKRLTSLSLENWELRIENYRLHQPNYPFPISNVQSYKGSPDSPLAAIAWPSGRPASRGCTTR